MGKAREFFRSPRGWVLTAFVISCLPGLGWGLPASDGWDNDGIAPRDFLAGLVLTFTPHEFYTYPPVQLVILTVVTSPVTIVALIRAKSFAPPDVIHEITKVPYMTLLAYGARLVSLFMGAGTIDAVSKMVREVRGERAALFALLFGALNGPLTYYARTSNLDVPYMFFGSQAMLAMVRAIAQHDLKRLRRFAVFAVLAIGTKDQAYALFLGAVPIMLVLWLIADPYPRREKRAVAVALLKYGALSVALFLVVDAVVFNPSGFANRVHFLLGSASQDYVHYTNDWLGRYTVIHDICHNSVWYYPLAMILLALVGIPLGIRACTTRQAKVAALVPLVCALSYTAFFNCVARRTDHRFVLPQMILLAAYGGMAFDLLTAIRWKTPRFIAYAMSILVGLVAFYGCVAVTANLVLDPRYDAEAWLRANANPGDLVEVHGLNVYLLRIPGDLRAIRVGPEPTAKRNPMPGIEEVQDEYVNAEKRNPRFIVVSQGWVWRYLFNPKADLGPGRVLPPTQIRTGSESDGSTFFQGLVENRRSFHRVHESRFESTLFPRLDFQASTSREIWIFERNP